MLLTHFIPPFLHRAEGSIIWFFLILSSQQPHEAETVTSPWSFNEQHNDFNPSLPDPATIQNQDSPGN